MMLYLVEDKQSSPSSLRPSSLSSSSSPCLPLENLRTHPHFSVFPSSFFALCEMRSDPLLRSFLQQFLHHSSQPSEQSNGSEIKRGKEPNHTRERLRGNTAAQPRSASLFAGPKLSPENPPSNDFRIFHGFGEEFYSMCLLTGLGVFPITVTLNKYKGLLGTIATVSWEECLSASGREFRQGYTVNVWYRGCELRL